MEVLPGHGFYLKKKKYRAPFVTRNKTTLLRDYGVPKEDEKKKSKGGGSSSICITPWSICHHPRLSCLVSCVLRLASCVLCLASCVLGSCVLRLMYDMCHTDKRFN